MTWLTAPRAIVLAVSVVAVFFLLLVLSLVDGRLGGSFGFLGFSIFGLFAIVMQVAFWAVVIMGGIWLAREMGWLNSADRPRSKRDALALLDRRYANGEISRSEYFQIKQDLEADS